MSTLRSMIGSDAEPPSVQWSAASVVSGDVMEIAKLMVLLIMLTLTACGLYQSICRPRAVQSQDSSSPNTSTPPPTEAMGQLAPPPSHSPIVQYTSLVDFLYVHFNFFFFSLGKIRLQSGKGIPKSLWWKIEATFLISFFFGGWGEGEGRGGEGMLGILQYF